MGTLSARCGWRVRATGLLFVCQAVLLSGCMSSSTSTQTPAATPASSGSSPQATGPNGDCGIKVTDAWVKAADSGMTAAFGVLANPGKDAVTLAGATSPAAASVELHEMAMVDGESVMRPIAGGLEIPAGANVTLAPGGNHLMLIGLKEALKAGDEVAITLQCATGTSTTITLLVKTFTGAQESYAPSASPTGS